MNDTRSKELRDLSRQVMAVQRLLQLCQPSTSKESEDTLTSSSDEEHSPSKKLRLQDICQESVVKNLGKTAESIQCRFSCGGSLPQVKSVDIHCKKECGDFSGLSLPADVANGKGLQEFLDTCSTASFGMGSQTVTDKAYRDALKLEPESYTTSFILASTTILNSIATVMTCGSPIRAELYKLNVYCSGGFFKAHVDTPRSSEMFGSLVVSLPAQFEGGALVTRHQGREVRFDWSSSSTTAQWAAFYSDVEHEVLPVTSGHRFTLTYNLYRTSSSCHPVSFDIAMNPLYKELLAALQMPHFMREGGTLGFFCQYRYVECESLDSDISDCALFLKGEDMVVYQVAKSVGLNVKLRPICRGNDWQKKRDYIAPTFKYKYSESCEEEDAAFNNLKIVFGEKNVSATSHIAWCVWSDERKVPMCSYVTYGNEPTCETLYQSAALLVEVPEFSITRGAV